MKKILAWLLVVALTAAIAVGGTLAYLTDTDEDVNVMTLGNVKIDQLEYERVDVETKDGEAVVQEFHDNKPLYPAVIKDDFDWSTGDANVDWGQIGKDGYSSGIWDPEKINNEQDKMVFVKNKGDYDAYVRTWFAFEAGEYTVQEFQEMFHLNLNDSDWTWEFRDEIAAIPGEDGTTTNYVIAVATYNKVLEPGALTEISLSQIALDSIADNAEIEGFGDTYQILVKTQAIQAQGFEDPDTALTEGFGTEHPFETDSAIRGIDLRTALHYLDGNTTGTKITAKVTNVIFGLNEDYPEILDEYEGTLVDVEQDVPVYAYYVPNGSNYDVYFLANDTIYTPKDSTELFYKMTSLQTVDTGNLDVGRTENMYRMFRECEKLSAIDVSDWNMSNATNTFDMFRKCKALPELDVSRWDVSSVENMNAMFQECVSLTKLDVSDWDVSKVTTMIQMFYKSAGLQELDVSRWDMGSVTNIQSIFAGCTALPVLDVSDWDTANVTNMTQAFMDCVSLTTLDVSDWDVGNVKRFKATFGTTGQNTGKMLLTDIDVSDWDMSSATDLEAMFYGCGQLTSVDISKWNVENVTKVPHMFTDCYKLETVDVSGWNTASLTCLDGMFNDCRSLKVVDLSSFSTGKVKEFSQLFEACSSLEKVIGLENWDTSSGQDFSEMFSGCKSLKELDLSSFDTRNANQNYTTYWPAHNDMFLRFLSGCISLERISFGPYFSYDGDGSAADTYKMTSMPAATGVEGWDGNWYDVDGNAYAPSEIPEETAATYYAVKPVTP